MKKIIIFFFVFSSALDLTAQKQNPLDTVNQPNLDMHKAVAMRKAGIILTFTGIGVFAAGGITSLIMSANPPDDPDEDPWYKLIDLVPVALGGLAGITFIVVGVPLKAIGESRINAKARLSLKKFDIVPENSMAFGLGITLRF